MEACWRYWPTFFSPVPYRVPYPSAHRVLAARSQGVIRPTLVPDGRQLRASGTVVYRARRMAVARAEIVNEDDKPVVSATSSMVDFPDRTWGEVSVADEAPTHDPDHG